MPAHNAMKTYEFQESLEKLPIPELQQSLARYLEALRPLQTKAEQEATEEAVREFGKKDGPLLQQKLQEYAKDKPSYIEEFWYESYLNSDNPVVLNLNPFFLLEDDPTPARSNQVGRAASLVSSSLAFVRALRREELAPDRVRNTPLCMYQYSRIFGTSRIPTQQGCVMATDTTAKHIIVLCRSQFYWFDVLDENADIIMTERDLALNFEACVADAMDVDVREAAKGAMGVLTTEHRRTWAGLREQLISDTEAGGNKECLNIVDSALFAVCLDDAEPSSDSELCLNMLCGTNAVDRGVQVGTCTNRWYDKLQIIVCRNGSAGINFEHTGADGHTILRYASDVYTDTILRFAKSINGVSPSIWPTTSPDPSKRDPASFGQVSTTPRRLEWRLTPDLSLGIRFAETRLADLIMQNEFEVLEFKGYGKSFITSMGFSPDAYVQMAFQAAYYSMYGLVESTYEPAMTKFFAHGRTEAIHSVTQESVAFVRKFAEGGGVGDKVALLREACEKHVRMTKYCAAGQGQDRHLYSLWCIWRRSGSEDLPALFADEGWEKLNTTVLSTSNCGNPALRQFGFGPTSGGGFGIGYIIKEDMLSVCASSKHRQTKRFLETLQAYFLDMRQILRQANDGKPRRPEPHRTRARSPEGETRQGKAVATLASAEDDGLDGYGYFDVGTMEALLRSEETKNVQRTYVGRRLRLNEY